MSFRQQKIKNAIIKSVPTTDYLNDGQIHRFKNKQHQITVINWNGTVKQLHKFMKTDDDIIDNFELYDDQSPHEINNIHFTQRNFGAEEPDDNHVYQSGIICDFNFEIPKNTLIVKYYSYHGGFYLPKYQMISEKHFRSHFPMQIE